MRRREIFAPIRPRPITARRNFCALPTNDGHWMDRSNRESSSVAAELPFISPAARSAGASPNADVDAPRCADGRWHDDAEARSHRDPAAPASGKWPSASPDEGSCCCIDGPSVKRGASPYDAFWPRDGASAQSDRECGGSDCAFGSLDGACALSAGARGLGARHPDRPSGGSAAPVASVETAEAEVVARSARPKEVVPLRASTARLARPARSGRSAEPAEGPARAEPAERPRAKRKFPT